MCGIVYARYSCRSLDSFFLFFQAEDGIRDLVRSRGLGDVYKRQRMDSEEGMRYGTVIGRHVNNLPWKK